MTITLKGSFKSTLVESNTEHQQKAINITFNTISKILPNVLKLFLNNPLSVQRSLGRVNAEIARYKNWAKNLEMFSRKIQTNETNFSNAPEKKF